MWSHTGTVSHSKKALEPWAARLGPWLQEPEAESGSKRMRPFPSLPSLGKLHHLVPKQGCSCTRSSFKVTTEKPFICTLSLTCVLGTLSWGQTQVTIPLQAEGLFLRLTAAWLPLLRKPQFFTNIVYPTSVACPDTRWHGWGSVIGPLPSTHMHTHMCSCPQFHLESSAWEPFCNQGLTLLNFVIWGQRQQEGMCLPTFQGNVLKFQRIHMFSNW